MASNIEDPVTNLITQIRDVGRVSLLSELDVLNISCRSRVKSLPLKWKSAQYKDVYEMSDLLLYSGEKKNRTK